MQHDSLSEEVTPVSDPSCPAATHVSARKPWKARRLTIHSALKTTPVSHRSRSPFTPIVLNTRVLSHTSADIRAIKRKLFTVAPTPRKKRSDQKATGALQPRQFRISGGKDRTQPVEVVSTRGSQRAQDGILTAQISKAKATAELNLRVFRTTLGAAEVNLKDLNALVKKSLVLRVLRREDDLLIVRRWSSNDSTATYDDDFAVVIPQKVLPEDHCVDFSQIVLFVPEPWSIVRLDSSFPSRSGLLVIPYNLEMIDVHDMSMILESCPLNSELASLEMVGGASNSDFEVPETEDPDEDPGNKCGRGAESEFVARTFSSISPHATSVTLPAVFDVVLRDFGMAIIQDDHGERAVYRFGTESLPESEERQYLSDLKIIPQRLPVTAIISLLASQFESQTELSTTLDHFRQLPDSSTLLVFAK